jgi:sigma-B regulation protein RsbU (phosphoserine phosphatase)
MLPLNPPSTPQLELACLYEPSLELGGDLCDFIELDEGRRGLVIADVAGKGLAASVLMASIRGALRILARTSRGLVRIVQSLNDQLCRDTLPAEFATLFYGEVSADGRSLIYCNAGHDPPLLLRGTELIELHSTGLAVGIDPCAEYETGRLRLRRGDILLLYTDGCVDALDFNDIRFGRQRLRDSLLRYADQPAERLARSILWDIRRFIGLARQTDDITLVLARVK